MPVVWDDESRGRVRPITSAPSARRDTVTLTQTQASSIAVLLAQAINARLDDEDAVHRALWRLTGHPCVKPADED